MHVVHPVRLPIKWLTCMYKRRKVAVFFSRLMYWQLLYSQVNATVGSHSLLLGSSPSI